MTPAGAIVVLGVAGCGKTTVGRLVAAGLGWEFVDADDHHPPANIAKMAAGVPLDDDDRAPWLAALAAVLRDHLATGRGVVLACSALRARYRALLRVDPVRVRFAWLHADFATLHARLATRQGHYMKESMLRSQFEALEQPGPEEDVLQLDAREPAAALAERIRRELAGSA